MYPFAFKVHVTYTWSTEHRCRSMTHTAHPRGSWSLHWIHPAHSCVQIFTNKRIKQNKEQTIQRNLYRFALKRMYKFMPFSVWTYVLRKSNFLQCTPMSMTECILQKQELANMLRNLGCVYLAAFFWFIPCVCKQFWFSREAQTLRFCRCLRCLHKIKLPSTLGDLKYTFYMRLLMKTFFSQVTQKMFGRSE